LDRGDEGGDGMTQHKWIRVPPTGSAIPRPPSHRERIEAAAARAGCDARLEERQWTEDGVMGAFTAYRAAVTLGDNTRYAGGTLSYQAAQSQLAILLCEALADAVECQKCVKPDGAGGA